MAAFDNLITRQINDYLSSVATKYGSLATLINIGKTYEGRDMLGVRISTGGGVKPVVFIDGGIHAREWIAPTTALYIINELVKPANRNLLDKVDVIVIPTINPDGYEYSHTEVSTPVIFTFFLYLFFSNRDRGM